MIIEKCCARANVVCPADSIRACWCSHSLKHRESKYGSILQSHCFLMLHCEFNVDFKNWQICAVVCKFGLLLPLLFSGDMNKFLSKGNVLSVQLFSIRSSDLGLFAASWLRTQAERAVFCMKLHFYIRQKLDQGILLHLGGENLLGGGLGAFAARTCKYCDALPSKHSHGAKALKKASTKYSLTFGSEVWSDGCKTLASKNSCSPQKDRLHHGFVPEFCICVYMGKK